MCRFLILLMLGICLSYSSETNSPTIPEYLQSISVKIDIPEGTGSGVVFTRTDATGTNKISFIWTAGHLFHQKNNMFDIFFLGLISTNEAVIDHAEISQLISVDGMAAPAGSNILARLIKCSKTNDLALLQLEKPFFNTNTAIFDLSSRIPRTGERVFSVSAPMGSDGTFSEGVYSFIGKKKWGKVFDQTTCVVYPGSSGGGFFLTNGICIGLAIAYQAPTINYIIPMRRIQEWAKYENLEWALDPTLPIPTEKEIKAITIVSNR